MATPADQRLLELLGKWLESLELHARYASLDDDAYARIQPWPHHQRPSRWIIDLARQKALALQCQVNERIGMGDATFADSLELMTFLANLVGAEHIERFIPLAAADRERRSEPADATGTREMPILAAAPQRDAAPAGTAQAARAERRAVDGKSALKAPAAATGARPAPHPPAYDPKDLPQAVREQVIADATRLVQWGRKWYELAELISSMADRPHLIDVRRILQDNKAVIDKNAGRG